MYGEFGLMCQCRKNVLAIIQKITSTGSWGEEEVHHKNINITVLQRKDLGG